MSTPRIGRIVLHADIASVEGSLPPRTGTCQ